MITRIAHFRFLSPPAVARPADLAAGRQSPNATKKTKTTCPQFGGAPAGGGGKGAGDFFQIQRPKNSAGFWQEPAAPPAGPRKFARGSGHSIPQGEGGT